MERNGRMSRADFVERALKIDSAIEHLTAAKLAAEDWMSKQAEVPDWLRDYVHRTTTVQIPVLERERVRLDTVMEAMNAGHNVSHNAVGLSDSKINTLVKRAYELSEDALTRLVNIEFTNEFFLKAAETGDALSVRLLLADGRVDPTSRNNEAIKTASANGHANVVRLLLEDGRANPTSSDYDGPIRKASSNGHVAVVRLLLEDGRADPASKRNDPIRVASFNGHAAVVELLLADSRVDPRHVYGLLDETARRGHAAVVKLLLEDKRVDPSKKQNEGLFCAAIAGHLPVVELLLADHRVLAAPGLNYAFLHAETDEIATMISDAMHRGGKRQTRIRHTCNRQTRHARKHQTRHARKHQTRHARKHQTRHRQTRNARTRQ